MAISFVGSATIDGTSVSLPVGTAAGDTVVASAASNTLGTTSMTLTWDTAGYTANEQFHLNNTEFDNVNLVLSYKVQGATPDASLSVTPSPAFDTTLIAYVLRGVHPGDPLDAVTQTALGGQNDNEPDPPSITSNTDNALIYIVGAITDDITAVPTPAGYSNYVESLHSEGGTDDIGHYAASRILATAGPEDPPKFAAGGGSSSTWIAASLAFKPSPGPFFDAFTAGGEQVSSFTHTPVGTPTGVLVAVVDGNESADLVTGVTYGGVPMVEVTGSPFAGTQGGTTMIHLYWLATGIPTGAQTVAVTTSQTDDDWQAYCLTYTGDNLEIHGTSQRDYSPAGNGEEISATLSLGGNLCAVAMFAASHNAALGTVLPLSGWTDRNTTDVGFDHTACHTYDLVGTADVAAGYKNSAGSNQPGHAVGVAIKSGAGGGGGVTPTTGSSSGSATSAATGQAYAQSVGSATATATLLSVAQAYAEAIGQSSGSATTTPAAVARATSVGSSAGSATTTGLALAIARATSSVVATSVGSAIAKAYARSVGSASGSAVVTGVTPGVSVIQTVGSASGSATAGATGLAYAQSVGSSSGEAVVTGVGNAVGSGVYNMHLGADVVLALYLGSTYLTRVYLGPTLVFDPSGTAPVQLTLVGGAPTVTQTANAMASSYAVNIPAVEADDLVIIVLGAFVTNAYPTQSAGYTIRRQGSSAVGAGFSTLQLVAKKMTAAAGASTVTFTTSVGTWNGFAHVYVIRNWGGTLSSDLQVSAAAAGIGTFLTVPNHTPTWGSDRTFWGSAYCGCDDGETCHTTPSAQGYAVTQSILSGAALNQRPTVASAWKIETAADVDEGIYSISPATDALVGFSFTVH